MPAVYGHPEAIVSTEWLAAHLDDPDLRIFDTTTLLVPPAQGSDAAWVVRAGRSEYEQAHIPGSGFLDLQGELSDRAGPAYLRFMMPSPADLGSAFAKRGIGDGSRAVLYSRGSASWATRVWWMLRAIGFDRAAVLDGGWDKWQLEGRPASSEPCDYPATSLTVHPRSGLFVGKDAVLAAIDDGATCTINALGADVHRGESPRYGRLGRIPGSVNVPAATLSDPAQRTFPAPEVAAEAFRSAGADGKSRHILYCGGGIAASYDAFLMYQLGYANLAIYDGSLTEWARDQSLPMEVG